MGCFSVLLYSTGVHWEAWLEDVVCRGWDPSNQLDVCLVEPKMTEDDAFEDDDIRDDAFG